MQQAVIAEKMTLAARQRRNAQPPTRPTRRASTRPRSGWRGRQQCDTEEAGKLYSEFQQAYHLEGEHPQGVSPWRPTRRSSPSPASAAMRARRSRRSTPSASSGQTPDSAEPANRRQPWPGRGEEEEHRRATEDARGQQGRGGRRREHRRAAAARPPGYSPGSVVMGCVVLAIG